LRARSVKDSLLDSPADRIIDEYFNRICRGVPGPTLDVGAGSRKYRCFFSNYISLDVNEYEGIDIIGDANHLPLKDELFSSIVCTAVLEHTKSPRKVVDEIVRVLREDGVFLLYVPFIAPRHDLPHDFLRFTEEGIRNLLMDCKLEIENLKPCGGFFGTLAGIWWWPFRYFVQKNVVVALAILPIYLMFVLLSILDQFDHEHRFSMGYIVISRKKES